MTTNDPISLQILQEVQATRAEVSALKVSVAQVVADARHRERQVDDHEERLRALEASDTVTKQDLEDSQRERSRKTLGYFGLALTVFGLIETALIAFLIKG